jgi:hypothetical protein
LRRRLELIGLLIVVLAGGAGLGWHLRERAAVSDMSSPAPASAPAAERKDPPAVGIRKAGVVLRREGQKQAEVSADQVEVDREMRVARFIGVPSVVLYDQNKPALRVKAGEILLDRHTDDLTVRGGIEITSMSGDVLKAEEARWVARSQRLVFPRGVEVRLGGHQVRARHLTVDLGLRWLEMKGDVDISFVLQEAMR